MAIEKYVKYVSRTVTIVHAGTRSAHSLLIDIGELRIRTRTKGTPQRRNISDSLECLTYGRTYLLGYQLTPSHMIHRSGRIAQRK